MNNKITQKIIKVSKPTKNVLTCLFGALSGLVNGLFGGGGGMLIVPLLTLLLGYKVKNAHATAILIILPLCIISALFYSYFGTVNFTTTLPVSIGVLVGGIIGAYVLSKLSSKIVSIIFCGIMIIAGAKLIFF